MGPTTAFKVGNFSDRGWGISVILSKSGWHRAGACIDQLYVNAYVPNLQVAGQVVTFLTARLGYPIPSPTLLDVKAFAAENDIPIL